MTETKEQLKRIFAELNARVEIHVRKRRKENLPGIRKAEVKILRQMSLLANERVSTLLTLAQTADLDAFLRMENLVKQELTSLLKKHGLIYDEHSSEIWIPQGAQYEELFDFEHVSVKAIDAESALLSKAVKAPEKNKQLIRQAIARGVFPELADRIEQNGGDLEFFSHGE